MNRSMVANGEKLAVVLMNLGGPDSLESVQPYLFNLFFDENIIALPMPVRWLLAKFIAFRRAPVAEDIYRHMGGSSPLLAETGKQAAALQKCLGAEDQIRVFIAMRHWHPMAEETILAIKSYGPDRIFLLPLYPQFSGSTSGSSFKNWDDCVRKAGLRVPTTRLCCYARADKFIGAHTDLILKELDKTRADSLPRILFSAHGLPQKQIAAGDPYLWQVRNTVRDVVSLLQEKTGLAYSDHTICFQSRVGPLKWLRPSTRDAISQAGREGREVLIVPISFVSEHSETLVELDIRYKAYAKSCGVPQFYRVPALGVHTGYIDALAGFVTQALSSNQDFCVKDDSRCPRELSRCHLVA